MIFEKNNAFSADQIQKSLDEADVVTGAPVMVLLPLGSNKQLLPVLAAGIKQIEKKHPSNIILLCAGESEDAAHLLHIYSSHPDNSFAQTIQKNIRNSVIDTNSATLSPFHPVIEFIQHALPSANILPLTIHTKDIILARRIGEQLSAAAPENTVMVVLANLEQEQLDSLEFADIDKFLQSIQHQDLFPDQIFSILAGMEFAAKREINTGTLLKTIPLSKGTQDTQMAASLMLWRYQSPQYTTQQKKALIQLARNAIRTYLETRIIPQEKSQNPQFEELRGVFVTLYLEKDLQGCIGHIQADLPLSTAVQEMAVAAATQDPRFYPVRLEEVDLLSIKIAVLSPMIRITPDQIKIGEHGLLMVHKGHRGILLPEVAVEHGWDVPTFLEHLCIKSGLSPTVLAENPKLYGFTSVSFSDSQ